MAITLVEARSFDFASYGFTTNTPIGSLLISALFDFTTLPLVPTDAQGNTWHNVFHGSTGFCQASIAWTFATQNTKDQNVVWTYTPVGGCMALSCYTGAGPLTPSAVFASQVLGVHATVVNCGPANTKLGAVSYIGIFGSTETYTSSSGATVRVNTTGQRLMYVDNITAAAPNYTETGTLTGTLANGGFVFVLGLTPPIGSSRLALTGVGT